MGTGLSLLQFSGFKAETFLQGQLTSDVTQLKNNESTLSAYCDYKGRMIASGWLFRIDADFYFLLSSDIAEKTKQHFAKFADFSKVRIADVSPAWQIIFSEKVASYAEGEIGVPIFPGAAQGCILSQKSIQHPYRISREKWDMLNIEKMFVLITAATQNIFIPQMLYYEKFGAVSFTKGCYVGQEIVARTQHLGKMKRHVYRGETEGASVKVGDDILNEQSESVGMVAAVAQVPSGNTAVLAVLSDAAITGDTKFTTKSTEPGKTCFLTFKMGTEEQ